MNFLEILHIARYIILHKDYVKVHARMYLIIQINNNFKLKIIFYDIFRFKSSTRFLIFK